MLPKIKSVLRKQLHWHLNLSDLRGWVFSLHAIASRLEHAQVPSFRQVLTLQAVYVLVDAALSEAMLIVEVYLMPVSVASVCQWTAISFKGGVRTA